MTLTFHPAAALFPMMSADEYAALVRNIAEQGQHEPITVFDGQIIDGRNRYKACCELGLKPLTREWEGGASVVEYVISLNLHRRHLDSTQRAFIALEALPMLEAEAQQRMRNAGERGADTLWGREKIPYPIEEQQGKATARAAQVTHTNSHYVSDAKRISEQAPDLAAACKAGDMRITEARRELTRRTLTASQPAAPTGKYRVIYADPPWSYGNTQPDYQTEQRDHYPVMDIADMCSLPIKGLAEDNAVLFLWVTSPILEDAFQVIKAWGFKYKTSFVWDKVKHNMGHYNSVRHELLLVCVRGSCQPDVPKLFDSVQSIERTAHSVKPEEFRTIIDTIYSHGTRIELFARAVAVGWDTWGNEV